jgi:FtsH-binding integral membrane protein
MDQSNQNTTLIGMIVLVVGVIITLFNTTKGQLTEKGYVTNVYLYIILAILLVSLMVVLLNRYNLINWDETGTSAIIKIGVLLVVMFAALFTLLYVDHSRYVLRHILWLIFIICIGILLYPAFVISMQADVLWKSVLTVLVLMGVLTLIANKAPAHYFDSWGSYLLMALGILIIFQLLDMFFGGLTVTPSRIKIYSWITIILFSGYVMYDTSKLYQHAQSAVIDCNVTGQSQLTCADYPGESLDLFLDILNLFQSVTNLQTI